MDNEEKTTYNPESDYLLMLARLKEICRKKGITLYALAQRTQMSPSALGYLMRGKTKPNVTTLLTICHALGISLGELVSGEAQTHDYVGDKRSVPIRVGVGETAEAETEMEMDAGAQALLHAYDRMPPWKRKLLVAFADMLETYGE